MIVSCLFTNLPLTTFFFLHYAFNYDQFSCYLTLNAKSKWPLEFEYYLFSTFFQSQLTILFVLSTYQSVQACSGCCGRPFFGGVGPEASIEHIRDATCRPAYS